MVSVLSKTISGSTQRFVNRSKREVDTTVCTLVDCLLAPHLPRLHTRTLRTHVGHLCGGQLRRSNVDSAHADLTGQCRDAMISGGFQKEMQQWLERFFVGVLPQQVRTWVCFRGLRSMPSLLGFFTTLKAAFKVVDHALVDGVTALYRVALRILKANEEDLLQATNGTGEQGPRVPGIALTPCSPPSPLRPGIYGTAASHRATMHRAGCGRYVPVQRTPSS